MRDDTEWMTAKEAAVVWNVSERTARRYFDDLSAPIKRVTDAKTGRRRLRRVLPVGTQCPLVKQAGNPRFADKQYQRELNRRRWANHMTKAEWDALEAKLDEAALMELRSTFPELGMPQQAADDEQLPPALTDEQDAQELPPQLRYPDKATRDRMARKAARQRR